MMAEGEDIVDFKEEDLLEMEEEELSQLGLETPDQLTTSELETLANIQAELDRLNKLEQIDASQIPTLCQPEIEIDGTVDSDDYFIREETVTDTPQEELIVVQEEEEVELKEELEEYEENEMEEEEEEETIEVETTPIEDLDIMMTTQEETASQTKLIQITSKSIKKQPLNVSGVNLSKSAEQNFAKIIFSKQPISQENTQRLVIKSSPPPKTIPLSQSGKLGFLSSPSSHQGLVLKSPTKIITSPPSLNITKQGTQQKVIIRQANESDQFRQMIRLPTSTNSLGISRNQQLLQSQQQQQQIRYIRLAPSSSTSSTSSSPKTPRPVALISKYPQQQTILIPTDQNTPFVTKKSVMIPTSTLPTKHVLHQQTSFQQPLKKIHKIVTPMKFQESTKSFTMSSTAESASSAKKSSPAPISTAIKEITPSPSPLEAKGLRPRKPCNCTKSQCLKLYCDCFANGEFCNNCNCVECCNNLDHEEDRQNAIKACLERNPKAFRPKIGKGKALDERRHNRGCNCKRSNCLKNYCECYEAKIPCSNNCKCIGCNNIVDAIGNEKKMDMHSANPRNKHLNERGIDRKGNEPPTRPFSFIESRIIKATCSNLLTEARKSIKKDLSPTETEQLILENFRKCLKQVIDSANLYMTPPQQSRRGIRNMPSRKRRSLFGR